VSTGLLLAMAVVIYALFGIFVSQAGGKIDPTLSSGILNGIGGLLPLVIWQTQRMTRSEGVVTEPTGLVFSILAGVTVAVFSIILVSLYSRGGELSYVFPIIYGGAIATTAAVGWLVLGDVFSWTHLAGVAGIVAGISLLALPAR
jgi:drug/metabolite transporter (DMT)-like permease